MIVRWPGRVPANATNDTIWYFADSLTTAAELAGATVPDGVDGISVVPSLLGQTQDTTNRFLYWELYEHTPRQAVRWGKWKGMLLMSHQSPQGMRHQ